METTEFRLHDLSRFPIVRLRVDDRTAAGTDAWTAEMDRLLARAEPFAIVASHRREREPSAEATRRARWYKERAVELVAVCRGMVYIEPDALARADLERQLARLRANFPVPFCFAADEDEAVAAARAYLA